MKRIVLILSVLLFVQCNYSPREGDLSEREKRYYREIITLYPKDLVSHLPDNIDNRKDGAPDLRFPRGRYMNFIHLALSCDKAEMERLKTEVASKAIGVYHFGDSCLTIPYNYETFEIIKSDSIRNLPYVKMLPLPNFKAWYGGLSEEICKEAVIYLLDAEKGRFLPDDCLSKSGVGLPEEWLHGYTKGLILYRNFVVYWLEVW